MDEIKEYTYSRADPKTLEGPLCKFFFWRDHMLNIHKISLNYKGFCEILGSPPAPSGSEPTRKFSWVRKNRKAKACIILVIGPNMVENKALMMIEHNLFVNLADHK